MLTFAFTQSPSDFELLFCAGLSSRSSQAAGRGDLPHLRIGSKSGLTWGWTVAKAEQHTCHN